MKISIKLIRIISLLLLTQQIFAQASRKDLTKSIISVRSTYLDQKNEYIGLQVRTDIKDSLIENRRFLKFKAIRDYRDQIWL